LEEFTLLSNILLGLTLAAPIGPVNVEIIKRGLASGFRQAFLTGAGAVCADATYLALIYFGLTTFLKNAYLQSFLGIAGSFILIYLGVKSIANQTGNTASAVGKEPPRIFRHPFAAGFALAISSPMTIVWWTGVFGALIASREPVETNLAAFFSCLSILLGCFLWVLSLSAALHWGRKIMTEQIIRLVSTVAGLFLIGFGVYFLYRMWMTN